MAVRPTATNINEELALRGTGEFGNSYDYLQSDPVSYFYAKNKSSGNRFLIDEMWTEAARRGETMSLISYLENANDATKDMSMFDKWSTYTGYNDYDGYMLAMAIPTLDDTEKKERKDEESGYVWGQYTDKEWATEILNSMFEGYDAQILEEKKANMAWYEKLGGYLASAGAHIVAGVTSFVNDIYNVGEGLLNMMVNWSGDEDVGSRFLYAFSNDATIESSEGEQWASMFSVAVDYFQKSAYEWERKYTGVVNAYDAWKAGYRAGESEWMPLGAQGTGASYTTWGKWWAAGVESIGYMLPTIALAAVTGGTSLGATTIGSTSATVSGVVSQAVFYTGIFSGGIKDTVTRATMNGQSYKDLNAGIVVLNAGIKAAAQLAIEQVLGKILGFSGLDRMLGAAGSKAAGKAGTKAVSAATATGLKAFGKAIARGAKDMFKEGLEEFLQDSSDGLIDLCFGGDYYERGMETLQISNLVDSFVVGALVSGVTGVVKNATVLAPSNRAVGTNPDGSIYKMGVFQTLNYRQALQTMAEWNETLHNPKAKEKAKIEAAFKMSVAMDTIGSVLQSMGTDRAIQANNLLMAQLENEAKHDTAVAKMSDPEYASKLYEVFAKEHSAAVEKYVESRKDKKGLLTKIKNAIVDKAKLLKKKGVNKIESMVTEDIDPADPDIAVETSAAEKLKNTLKALGADVIVGVDGNIVTKSGQVVFADNRLVQAGDIEEIVRGISYEQVQAAISTELTPAQKKLLTNAYEKVTGVAGSVDEAITALLFDKTFYTYVLLAQNERTKMKVENRMKALEMFATVDKLVKAKVSPEVAAGRVTEAAYKKLMEKVQATMRTGLVTYATQYVKLDLGNISNDVLSPELKAEIKKHRNVIFTETIDDGLKDTSTTPPTEERIQAYERLLNKFVTQLTAEQIEKAKAAARSTNYNERVDAYTLLTQLAKSAKVDQENKLVYLPTDNTGDFAMQNIGYIEKFFGSTWLELCEGNFDPNKLTKEAKEFITTNGYDMSNKQSRLACMRDCLYMASNKSLTLGNNFELIQVLDRDSFLKSDYTDNKKLFEALKDGKTLTLADIAKVNLPDALKGVKVILDPNLPVQGFYKNGTITINGVDAVATVLHESTHATQDALAIGTEDIQGGSFRTFNLLPKEVISDIDKYMQENFPLTYNYMSNLSNKVGTPQLVYFMLAGELQANSTLTTHMFETGFKWADDRQTLVSPDGKKRWPMKPATGQEGVNNLLRELKGEPKKKVTKPKSATETTPKTEVKPTTKTEVPKVETKPKTKVSEGDGKTAPKQVKNLNQLDKYVRDSAIKHMLVAEPDTNGLLHFKEARGAHEGYGIQVSKTGIMKIDAKGYKNLKEFLGSTTNNAIYNTVWGSNSPISSTQMLSVFNMGKGMDVIAITTQEGIDYLVKPQRDLATLAQYQEPKTAGDHISEDLPLTKEGKAKLAEDPEIQEYMKNAYLKKKDGRPIVWYRGATEHSGFEKMHSENMPYKIGEFYTTSYKAANQYGQTVPDPVYGTTRGYITNVTKDKTLMIDVEGSEWSKLNTYLSGQDARLLADAYNEYSDVLQAFQEVHYSKSETVSDVETTVRQILVNKNYDQDLFDKTVTSVMNKYNLTKENTIKFLGMLSIGYDVAFNGIVKHDKVVTEKLRDITPSDFDEIIPVRTDDFALLGIMKGVDAVVITNVIEDLSTPINDLILLSPGHQKRVTFTEHDVDWDQAVGKQGRYISNKVAKESNLKYWIQKGKQIQIDQGVANFVVATTKDFDKLPRVLQQLIKKGALTRYDIIEYVATAANINEYTFKAIAEHVFENSDMSQLTYKDMRTLMDNIEELAALSGFLYNKDKYLKEHTDDLLKATKKQKLEAIKDYISKALTAEALKLPAEERSKKAKAILARKKAEFAKLKTLTDKQIDSRYLQAMAAGEKSTLMKELEGLDPNTKMSPEEMLSLVKRVIEATNKDPELAKAWLKETKKAQSIQVMTQKGNIGYTEAHADTKQLNLSFFSHYHNTLASMFDINNIGKTISSKQYEQELIENVDTGELKGGAKTAWNWIDKQRKAEINYESDEDIKKTLDSIDREDKIKAITNYIYDAMAARVEQMSESERKAKQKAVLKSIKAMVSELPTLSELALNKRYLQAMGQQASTGSKLQRKVQSIVTISPEERNQRTFKNAKDQAMNVANTLTKRIAGLKVNYNNMPADIKAYFDSKTFTMSRASLKGMSIEQIDALRIKIKDYSAKLAKIQSANARKQKAQETAQRLLAEGKKVPKKVAQEAGMKTETKTNKPKKLRERIEYVHKTKIREHTFEVDSREAANTLVQNMLNTAWDKAKKTQVQGLTNNTDDNVANADTFYKQNAELFMGSTLGDIEQAVRFFLEARLSGVDTNSTDFRKFQAVKMYFLGYVLGETGKGGLFADLNANLKTKIENVLRQEMSAAGTLLSIWNNIKNIVDPTKSMASAAMEIDGVPLTDTEKTELFEAAKSSNIERIKAIQDQIIKRITSEKTGKKSILRKVSTIRSMSMLSSPVTWLRNIVSNAVVKRINKLSSAIGNNLWKGKTVSGQLKMNAAITPEIQSFIAEHFIDNKLFDTIVLNLSKYNPSEIALKNKTATGQASKEAIFAQMVVKSMYNQYYNENLFKSKWMNDVHGLLMKALSDNNYVREAAIRYFGKIIAEKGYDLHNNEVSDNIMNDFANAIGLALSDYMHSDNVMHKIEAVITEKGGEGALFAWKLMLPFASSSWSWFKAALKLSPLGLGRAIYNMTKLEGRVARAEAAWAQGKSQISPELTEYMARRDLGQGVIGTIAWGVGILLASMGFIRLEDDDYGKPKLCIGNLKIDVSTIFGSSSLLAGAALVTGLQDNGVTISGLIEGLRRSSDVLFDEFFLLDVARLDMYGDSVFDMITNNLETIALSFIPNLVSWLAGFTYSGNLNKKTFWGKAAAKIPFLGAVVNEKKVDPYIGSEGDWWDTFNRVVPYFSVEIPSEGEKLAESLGLNKQELKGQYEINGESFNLNAKQVNELNQAYGSWNAKDIADFYQNKTAITIKVGNVYKVMRYNQMTDGQRSQAVQQIMSKNATYAKIKAWTEAGNKYYASATDYIALRKLGITTNVFRGTQGYVSKK